MLLQEDDPKPVIVLNEHSISPFVFVCDHAGNAIPKKLEYLGLTLENINEHIAIDKGIREVGGLLSSELKACFIMQSYSRLVIDCNRSVDHPNLIVKKSDGKKIPGNMAISPEEKTLRLNEIYYPYHHTISSILIKRKKLNFPSLLISLHSFTKKLMKDDVPRPWHIGVLHDKNNQFSLIFKKHLKNKYSFPIGDNKPYALSDENDYTIPFHSQETSIPYLELEIRQDLIETMEQQQVWSNQLKNVLFTAYEELRAV
ncbi:hypothetical protein COMNV_00473 [Commensalibacter sp. Nvir]|uniref:N-formylglutamate amidohydrolase n=1 Tax=Commensalibacter sp. Nvir TaxID=3069817 RepID=UPI002D6040B4|nr:hypothetical protein COMNV_00473 [Commensalibacter sp. Nvir]